MAKALREATFGERWETDVGKILGSEGEVEAMSDRDSVPKTAKMDVAAPGDTLESVMAYQPDNATIPLGPAMSRTTPSAGATPMAGRLSPAFVALHGSILEHAPPQRIRVRYPVDDAWKNVQGATQAGFIVAMMEAVGAMCAFAHDPLRQSSTLELSTRFFRSVRSGNLIVDGAVLRAGKSTITVEAVAWDDASELCAKMSMTNLYVG